MELMKGRRFRRLETWRLIEARCVDVRTTLAPLLFMNMKRSGHRDVREMANLIIRSWNLERVPVAPIVNKSRIV